MVDVREPDRILYAGERTTVRRVPWPGSPTGTAVRKEATGPAGAERLRRERAVLERLAGVDGVPRPLRAVDGALLFEDDGGVSLAASLPDGGFDPAWVVRFAGRLAAVVARVHGAGVIHKDINPANVVLAGDGETPVLIDFDLASTFAEERPEFTHHSEITGTLAYLAPEQTGRFGRPVDHRADLYAFGATLYQLLTGRPPFGATDGDPLQLIHAHLAQRPQSPSTGHPAVPHVLSAIVLRLLAKEPDERYQSAEGLAHDLARLETQLRDGAVPGFPLAERDFPRRLAAPSRLVGRDREIAVLADAYRGARAGSARGLLVSGASGVGKTSLLDELRPMVTAQGGWFVTGKFDQYRQDLTADAVPQALRALGRLLLAEPERQLARHRERLLEVLGPDAGLITGLPEFGALLRVPAEPLDGDPSRIGPRLRRATLSLLRTVASPSRPIVMIIDDLQWATAFPVAFLDAALSAGDLPGVLLVGAYRSGEVDATHPLSAVIHRWEREGIAPPRLELENLPTGELAALLAEMLRLPVAEARPLAEAVGVRTGGNPYDTVELVNALRREGVLTVSDGGWSWDAAEIRRFVGAGEVVELLSARIDRLPATTRGLLHVMACLGGELDVAALAEAAGTSPARAGEGVAAALEDGLLVPVATDGGGPGAAVRFRHDRVQQAAYANQPEDARRALHLGLARRLAADPRAAGVAAEQYLHVVADLTDPAEVRRAANLFVAAAADLRLLNAPLAQRHLAAAETALVGAGTAASDPLLGEVRRARHAVLYALGRLDDADELYDTITRRNAAAEEVAAVTGLQLSSLINRDRHQEAIAIGLTLLGRLGMAVPEPERMGGEIGQGLQELRRWVAEDDPAQDLTRPQIGDPRLLAACEVINRLMPAAFYTDQTLLAWLTLRARRIWAEHGPCEPLMGPLAHAGILSVAALGDYRTGYDAVRRVLAVGEARGLEPTTSQVRFLFTVGSVTWVESLEDSVTQARRAREGLLAGGDLHHAAYTPNVLAPLLMEIAPTLDAYRTEVDGGIAFAVRTGNRSVSDVLLPHRQLVKVLLGRTDAPGSFDDEEFDEGAFLAGQSGNGPAAVAFHTNRALAALLFRDVPLLVRHTAQAMPLLATLPGMHPVVLARLLRVLAIAEQLRAGVPDADRAALAAELEASRAWLAARTAEAPANFGHVLTLVDAERAWAEGDHWAAAAAFDTALRDLETRTRPLHRALTAERAALFHLERGLERAAHGLLVEARRHYAAWGAVAKVRHLDREYPFLRVEGRAAPAGAVPGDPAASRTAGHSLGHSVVLSTESIDLLGVLRAAQALSSETNLDRLRGRVVEVLTLMTGATGVQVVLWNDESGDWYLPEAAGLDALAAGGRLPISAFRYAERTGEPLCVEDATRDDRFARDPYLAGVGCCSLLVVPILSGGTPRAMLVLENRLTRGAFSADRLDAVMLIAGQLAVCLDNALAERFRSLVQRSSDLTLVCDAAGTISYASTASVELLGVDDAALAGRSVGDLVRADDRDALLAWIGDTRRPDVLPCRLASGAGPGSRAGSDAGPGAARWVEATLTDLTADPAVGGLVLRLRDVTERRRLEDELRHAQKLESVGQLAAGIAHEINTPIQFIGDNLRFLTDAFGDIAGALRAAAPRPVATADSGDAGDAGDADVDFLLEEIPQALRDTLEGATRVATIVRAMKAFGHPGGEDKAQADLNEAVRNTLVVATSEIRQVADVELDLDPQLPPVVCNLGEINQVLLNLVINAVHAMAGGTGDGQRGTLTLRTRRDGDAVVIEVGDTGTGVPAEIADRIFDQFFTTKDVGVGTGQGLALAHTFVHDHHGGTITFESVPGTGTTFAVRLPTP